MISKEAARDIVQKQLDSSNKISGMDLIILDECTRELDFGWVFFFDSKRHCKTDDVEYMGLSNAPIIVTYEGESHSTGTAHQIDYYIDRFRRYGKP